MKICLDAGHYGKYNQSPADKRYYESDMVWKLHLLQKKYLGAYGIEVVTTRADQATDLALYERGTKSRGCDLFISNHSNAVADSVNNKVDYPVSYCAIDKSADEIGLALAQCVEVVMGTKQAARIEHRTGSNGDYYGVLRGATAAGTPALILEHSFHTNAAATAWLLDDANLDRLAKAEVETIARFYGIEEPEETNKSGWREENGGWRFYLGDTGNYVQNDWYKYEDDWYWFNGAGMMISDVWYEYKDHWYYFASDGAMVTGLQLIKEKWYYFNSEGHMATAPVTFVPDKDGALQYPAE